MPTLEGGPHPKRPLAGEKKQVLLTIKELYEATDRVRAIP